MSEEDEVEIPLTVKDHASKVLEKIAHAGEKMSHTMDHAAAKMAELGMAVAGLAGGIGLERMVETGKEYLEQISRMSKLTGQSANSIAGMRHAFELSGLSGEQLAATMSAISKKSAMMQEGGGKLLKQAKQWGVDLEHGPQKTMTSMAKLVEKHKIGAGQVSQLLRVSGDSLGGMMDLLKKGPEEVGKMIDDGRAKNKFVNEETMGAFERYQEASRQIHQAWTRLSAKVVTSLAPVLEKLSDKLSAWMDKMGDGAGHFTDILVKGMEKGIEHARTIGKLMAANMLLEKFHGHGLSGTLLQVGEKGGKMGEHLGEHLLKGAGKFSKYVSTAKSLGTSGSGAMRNVGTFLGPIARILGPLAGAFSKLGPIVTGFMGLAGKASIIGLAVFAIGAVMSNLNEIGSRLKPIIDIIWQNLSLIGKLFSDIFKSSAAQSVAALLGQAVVILTEIVGGVAVLVNKLLGGPSDPGRANAANINANERWRTSLADFAYNAAGGGAKGRAAAKNIWYKPLKDEHDEAMRKKAELAKRSEDNGAQTGLYQDFRGSRFEITQAFSEGFDPDRVASAFANDLGSLGERKLQSGFSPLFGIR